ncbi:tetratricopeptide repeat protein [Pseudobdellovibrio sp. HCB154]|uniref:tetratricopeptide repeat protein n=1 Tax=Pseudobdellovibrio sp. HCB154 TaxID=3386277 RepID=UPI0039170E45
MAKNKIILAFASLTVAISANAQKVAPKRAVASTKTSQISAPKITTLNRVNLPSEKSFQPKETGIQMPAAKAFVDIKPKAAKSPDMVVLPKFQPIPVLEQAKVVIKPEHIAQIPIVKPLDFGPEPLLNEPQSDIKNLVEIKPEEYKMIQALIFMDYNKRYDLAMALFVELMDVPQYAQQATYHYAETALGLKLYSEFREKMLQVTKEAKDPMVKKMAVESLVKNMQYLQISDIEAIDPVAKQLDVDTVNHTSYLLKKAKYYSEKGNLKEFENALLMIPTEAPEYKEGTLLKAVLNYRRGQVDEGITELEVLWPLVEEKKKDQIRNLTALTLARLYFQKGDYKAAYKYYLSVDKSSGQWLQSMVEQAWTQILANDNIGAAGNMFTLHTEFFTKAYAPETYVVRTVGYLNLCQYGDGVHVLEDLNKRYKKVQEELEGYQKANPKGLAYYDLVKSFLKNTKQEIFEGVPRSFVVELARHPTYMNIQSQINAYEDENSRFNKVTIDLIRKERDARLEMLKAKNEFSQAQRDGKKGDGLRNLEKKYLAKGVEHLIYSRARNGIKKMREAALARLTKEENTLREKAGKNLQGRFGELVASLDRLIDQQEVLSYEIYSGAGEHIRYQMAGGEGKQADKAPASLTPDDKDNYAWKFKGEVWDDEIGHYRSSLKNVCPQDENERSPSSENASTDAGDANEKHN